MDWDRLLNEMFEWIQQTFHSILWHSLGSQIVPSAIFYWLWLSIQGRRILAYLLLEDYQRLCGHVLKSPELAFCSQMICISSTCKFTYFQDYSHLKFCFIPVSSGSDSRFKISISNQVQVLITLPRYNCSWCTKETRYLPLLTPSIQWWENQRQCKRKDLSE